jgi:hypothetical protein
MTKTMTDAAVGTINVPGEVTLQPGREALAWHRENTFLG